MNTQKLLIPCGYNVEQHNETVDIATAGQILSSRKQRRYSWAIRHEWQANLTRHVWVCPHCNAHIPAYPEYFGKRSSFEKLRDRLLQIGQRFNYLCLRNRIKNFTSMHLFKMVKWSVLNV